MAVGARLASSEKGWQPSSRERATPATSAPPVKPLQIPFAALMHSMALGIKVDPYGAERAFAFQLILAEDYDRRVLGYAQLKRQSGCGVPLRVNTICHSCWALALKAPALFRR